MSIQLLPEEIFLHAVSYLPTWGRVSISHTSSSWRSLTISAPRLWANLVVYDQAMLDSLTSRSGTMAISLDLTEWTNSIKIWTRPVRTRPSLHGCLGRIVKLGIYSYMLDASFMRLVLPELQTLFVCKAAGMAVDFTVAANWPRDCVPKVRRIEALGIIIIPPGMVWDEGSRAWQVVPEDDTTVANRPSHFDNLHELNMTLFTKWHIPKLFSISPNLVVLRLYSGNNDNFTVDPASMPPMEQLERLQLDSSQSTSDWTLTANWWNLPKLTSLVLTCRNDTVISYPRLKAKSEHQMLRDKLVSLILRRGAVLNTGTFCSALFAIYRSSTQTEKVTVRIEDDGRSTPRTLELIAKNREAATIVSLDLNIRALVEALRQNLEFPAVTSLVITVDQTEYGIPNQTLEGSMKLPALETVQFFCGHAMDDDHAIVSKWFSSLLQQNIMYEADRLKSAEIRHGTAPYMGSVPDTSTD